VRLLPADATDDQILDLCRDWVERLAAGRVGEAIDLLWIPADSEPPWRWTPDSLTTYIANLGSWTPTRDRSTWRITSLQTAKPSPDRAEVQRRDDDHQAGTVLLDVPLNGGDLFLTAVFVFGPHEGRIAVEFHRLLAL
jgi:hypothetical protein